MRKIILILIMGILSSSPELLFSQASIYQITDLGNTFYFNNDPVPIVGNLVIATPAPFTMYNFEDDEEYKIKIVREGSTLAQNLSMDIGNVVRASNSEFTWYTGNKFHVSYYIATGTQIGLSETLNFEIYRKRPLGIWDWQTTFHYEVWTVCMNSCVLDQNTNNGFPLLAGDYEVSNTLTVSTTVYPNGGVAELDAGASVTLLPGFKTDLSSQGSVLVIIDGCVGAYRQAIATAVSEETKLQSSDILKIYPNPVQNELTVSIPQTNQNGEVEVKITDLNGRVMYAGKQVDEKDVKISMDKFAAGIYFITVTGSGINHVQKLVKTQ